MFRFVSFPFPPGYPVGLARRSQRRHSSVTFRSRPRPTPLPVRAAAAVPFALRGSCAVGSVRGPAGLFHAPCSSAAFSRTRRLVRLFQHCFYVQIGCTYHKTSRSEVDSPCRAPSAPSDSRTFTSSPKGSSHLSVIPPRRPGEAPSLLPVPVRSPLLDAAREWETAAAFRVRPLSPGACFRGSPMPRRFTPFRG